MKKLIVYIVEGLYDGIMEDAFITEKLAFEFKKRKEKEENIKRKADAKKYGYEPNLYKLNVKPIHVKEKL